MFTPGLTAPGIIGFVLIILGVVLTANTFLEGLIMILAVIAILVHRAVFCAAKRVKGHHKQIPAY